ncbi:hypothetical protein Pint_24187 [Pistacia integerrima]|uniref:Uncharacterized protein n=1 Tax=Pistacia integerrima TaxID=434235 RepID=A0ACC0YHB7_9ROSI|nr:hypothetical protein Pint_24187 [Pistacia integerrima]
MKEDLEGCGSSKRARQADDVGPSYLAFLSDDEEEQEHVRYGRSRGKQLMGDRDLVLNLTPLRSLGYVDPGWEHGVAQDEKKKKVKCNYCGKVVSGGVNRFKQHLARIPGEVAPCNNAPEEVYLKMKENMKWHRTGRRQKWPDVKDQSTFYIQPNNGDKTNEQEEEALNQMSKERLAVSDRRLRKDLRMAFKEMSPHDSFEPLLKKSRLDSASLKSPHGVPLQAADSQYFHSMLELVGQYGQGLVITDNTPSYKTAGKMLEEKRRNLFWMPCATYCIDKMLEDFLKLKCVSECMEKAQKITKFIYNQISLLNLMKKEFTQEQELLRPSDTRYASSFATLKNLLDHRIDLRRMFQSNIWISSQFSRSDEGKEVEKTALNATFWKKVMYVLKSVEPIMEVLQKVNTGESPSMPYVYNDIYRAKVAIKSFHGDDVRKYGPFWSVIDDHWNLLIHHPLYVAAYFLNPSYRYRPHFVAHPEVVRGLNECIVRLEPDNARRIAAISQISDYSSAKADFGTELAISTRTGLDPAAWWQQHGISCLELQRIAVRILSQTCTSIQCEHNWSIYDQVHRQRHSRAAQKRINDLTYVHYNLRLREHHMKKRSDDAISFDSVLQEHSLDDWINEGEKQASQDEVFLSLHSFLLTWWFRVIDELPFLLL